MIFFKWILLLIGFGVIAFGLHTFFTTTISDIKIGTFSVKDFFSYLVLFIIGISCFVGFYKIGTYLKGTDEYQIKHDTEELYEIASTEIPLTSLLAKIAEPKYFVIAPMSYNTKEFDNTNANDSILFGLQTKDNSKERHNLLTSAITKFQSYVDSIPCVSFIDRSKIEAIEAEQHFQISDWSNDKKTADIGQALNANILMFLDHFSYINQKGGQYSFEAKFIDVNTMQSASYMIIYEGKDLNPPKKELAKINFNSFATSSAKNNPFEDEINLAFVKKFRTAQNPNSGSLSKVEKVLNSFIAEKNTNLTFDTNQNSSPFALLQKLDFSEYDINTPNSALLNASSIYFDGFGTAEVKTGEDTETATYTFEPCDMFVEKIGNDFYTDGKIGSLTLQTNSGYEKFEVFTLNNREYFIQLGSANLPKATINYYLQMLKK